MLIKKLLEHGNRRLQLPGLLGFSRKTDFLKKIMEKFGL